jgi:hypothetical protein
MSEKKELETIDFAYATYGPYIEITDELDIVIKSDDGGRHLQFSVLSQDSAKYLRESVPHTFEGYRTIIRYTTERKEG